jgi:hypothetical protein
MSVRRVLVIEDDAAIRRGIVDALRFQVLKHSRHPLSLRRSDIPAAVRSVLTPAVTSISFVYGVCTGGRMLNGVRSDDGSSVCCDKCATVPSLVTDFPERIRADGHVGFRSEHPRVGGSIPPLGIVFKDLPLPPSPLSPPNPAESTGTVTIV